MNTGASDIFKGVLTGVGALAFAIAIAQLRAALRKRNARLKEQMRHRDPESDEQFITHCELKSDLDSKVAIVSRAIIANWENVPPASLHATDRWDRELDLLTVTVDFDALAFANALREKLGVSLDKREIEHLLYPDLPPSGATLKDFVCRVVQAARRTQESRA